MLSWNELREEIVLWEDEHSLVVNKPSGLSVMGERHDTDLVTMAADAGEPLRWVNRIDKVTSGAVVLAKTQKAHGVLTRQFAKRTVEKAYFAICHPGGFPEKCTIDLPLLKAGSGKIRGAAETKNVAYDSKTHTWYAEPEHLLPRKNYPSRTDCANLWEDARNSVVLAMPVTGRRHQIRVHLAWTGHAIVGDPLFKRPTDQPFPRTYLHSLRIAFESAAPRPEWVEVEAVPDADFWEPVSGRADVLSPEEMLNAAHRVLPSSPGSRSH